jgi:hypothetical protein
VHLKVSHVGRGEGLAGLAAIVLLVLLFAAKWYGPGVITSGRVEPGTVTGWQALIHLRWLLLVTIALAVGLTALATAGRRTWAAAPRVVVVLCALASLLWLGYRVLISIPPGQKAVAYVGLGCSVAILAGAGFSLWDGRAPRARGSAPGPGR